MQAAIVMLPLNPHPGADSRRTLGRTRQGDNDATLVVTFACYLLAQPVPGIGIAIPSLVPPIIAAMAALLVARTNVAAVAYISGSLGTLIGADLLNLSKVQGL